MDRLPPPSGPPASIEARAPARPRVLVVDCDECAMQHTPTCADCLVTFLDGTEPAGAVVIDVEEARALRRLSAAGLVPELRHARRTG